jgi:hypothetical protein
MNDDPDLQDAPARKWTGDCPGCGQDLGPLGPQLDRCPTCSEDLRDIRPIDETASLKEERPE